MKKYYEIKFRHPKPKENYENKIFDDIQWKEYGVRAKIDDDDDLYIYPYTSIFYIREFEE